MEHIIRIGDRYAWYLEPPHPSTVWEIVDIVDETKVSMLCVEGTKYYLGEIIDYQRYGLIGGEYLGNFSKANNFNNLYDILYL